MTTEHQYAGAIVMQPDLYWQNQVDPADVRDETARDIVAAVADMLREGKAVDVVSVSERTRLPLRLVGEVCQAVYSPVGAASAADLIRAAAVRRRAEAAAAAALEAIREGADAAMALSQALEKCTAQTEEGEAGLDEALAEDDEAEEKPRKLITQIPKLNDLVPI